MNNKNSNQKKYIVSWGDGEHSDMMNSLKECERHIMEVIEDSFVDIEDILVYEVSATYVAKNKCIELTKLSAGAI
jgi:hypothetical protein